MSRILLCLMLCASAVPAVAQPAPPPPAPPAHPAPQAGNPPPPGSYQRGQGQEEQVERQTRTLELGAEGELSLNNIAGDIVVSRGGGNETTIEIVRTARGRTVEEARELLGRVEVSIVERDGRAEVKTVYNRTEEPRGPDGRGDRRGPGRMGERGRRVNVSVAYTVTAPQRTRVSVGSVSGNVKIVDIRGDVRASAVSGNVHIAGAGRVAEAKSVAGNVEIADSSLDGDVEAQSVSGRVLVRKVKARRIEAGSISGGVSLQDVQSERVEGHTINGTVEYDGALSKGGRYEFASHSGGARVTLSGGTGFELEARSFSGSVRADLPLTDRAPADDERQGRGRGRSLRGVHGDGSAVLSITTFSGSIVVGRR